MSRTQLVLLLLLTLVVGFTLGLWFIQPHSLESTHPTTGLANNQSTRPAGELQGYQVDRKGITRLTATGSCNNPNWIEGPLIVKPGPICVDGQQFTLTHGGARFYKLYRFNRYYIVDDRNLLNILSAISWATNLGTQDETSDIEALQKNARYKKLSLRCNFNTFLTNRILKQLGYTTRDIYIQTLAKDAEMGGGSHYLLEVRHHDGNWFLADVSNNTVFRDANGTLMNARDVVSQFRNNTFNGTLDSLAEDLTMDSSGSTDQVSGYNYLFLFEGLLSSSEQRKRWYQKTFHLLFISEQRNGALTWYFTDPSTDNRNDFSRFPPNYVELEPDEFNARFYTY